MDQNAEVIAKAIDDSLKIIEQDREKEIISRRFGLSGSKETLEQIGDMLSITRERVRQLEKAVLIRLRISTEDGNIPEFVHAEKIIIKSLAELGKIAKVSDLAVKIFGDDASDEQRLKLSFIGEISSNLTVVEENDNYYNSIGIAEYGDEKTLKHKIDEIISYIRKNKAPLSLDELYNTLNYEHPDQIRALASVSKNLATLNGLWGLANGRLSTQRTSATKSPSFSKRKGNQCTSKKSPKLSKIPTFAAKTSLSKPFTTNSSKILVSS